MRVAIEDVRLAMFDELQPRTFVKPTSHSWTGVFSIGMIVGGSGMFEGKGVLVLDGQYAFQIIKPSGSDFSFQPIAISSLLVDGIDSLQESSYSNNHGALVATTGNPLLCATFSPGGRMPFGQTCYVDLSTGEIASLTHSDHQEAFGRWTLIGVNDATTSEIVLCDRSANDSGRT